MKLKSGFIGILLSLLFAMPALALTPLEQADVVINAAKATAQSAQTTQAETEKLKALLTPLPDPDPDPVPVPTTRKYHPGHYVEVGDPRSTGMTGGVDALLAEPLLTGIKVKIYWAHLEPNNGHYDFSKIKVYLDAARKANKRLVIELWYVCFTTCLIANTAPVPFDMIGWGATPFRAGKVGAIARVWEPAVMDRLIALTKAIGASYDADPHFQGLRTAESAVPVDKTAAGLAKNGWSDAKFEVQIKRLATAGANALPRSIFWTGLNWGGISPIAAHIANTTKGGIAHPDTTLAPVPIFAEEIKYKGRIPVFASIETGAMTAADTEEAVLLKGVNQLGAAFIGWSRYFGSAKTSQTRGGNYYFRDFVLPVIRKYPGLPGNVPRPSNF